VLAVKVSGKSISDITSLSLVHARDFMDNLTLTERESLIASQVLREIRARLNFLIEVGLTYLDLSRAAGSLSGGEAQRIRLATQIGSALVGVLYVLDEPSIGLHQRDNERLIGTLERLRDIGNTVLVVEHDEGTMRAADHLIDMGPGAGEHGGHVVAAGTAAEVTKVKESVTGQYLSGERAIPYPAKRRKPSGKLTVSGAVEHNLKDVSVEAVAVEVDGSGVFTIPLKDIAKANLEFEFS
jgi:excinuclease ABC subunit A